MQFKNVHCLFERSGTFKNAFQKKGFYAYDYDIEEEKAVDTCIDIFQEIEKAIKGLYSCVFSAIDKEDLVMAFFPCTFFSDQSQLLSRGDSFGQKQWSVEEKLLYSEVQMQRRWEYFSYLCQLAQLALKNGFKLVIENPYGKCNFLKQFFPIKPGLIVKDRRAWGDFFKKPTQFFFVNCEPEFFLEKEFAKEEKKFNRVEDFKGFARSMISPEFAENFIENVIL